MLQQALNLAGHQIRLLGAAPLRPLLSRSTWFLNATIASKDELISKEQVVSSKGEFLCVHVTSKSWFV